MTTLFWGLEYGKVLLAYLLIMYIWPEIVFRKFLKGKRISYQFAFCTTVMVLIINTLVLGLGLVHLLKPWVFNVIMYGIAFVFLARKIKWKTGVFRTLSRLIKRSYGLKLFITDAFKAIGKGIKHVARILYDTLKGHIFEYFLVGVVVIFGMIYFTYGTFQNYSYGFGDMYPHNAWIYGLTQGQIFSAGVYPEGMHCFVYAMHTMFGIRIYSCMLFTAGVHSATFLLAGYVMLKELFRWKYTAVASLALFLTIDVICIESFYAQARLQWTLPQEFAFYAVFLCAAFLARYIKSVSEEPKEEPVKIVTVNPELAAEELEADKAEEESEVEVVEEEKTKALDILHANDDMLPPPTEEKIPFKERFVARVKKIAFADKLNYTPELLIFMMALAVTIVVHFYATIMAFYLCVALVPVLLTKIFKPKNLGALVVAVIAALMIAILPMGGALASGIPFQGSIGWAMNVINGTDAETNNARQLESSTQNSNAAPITTADPGAVTSPDQGGNGSSGTVGAPVEKKPNIFVRVAKGIAFKAQTIFHYSYITLYGKARAWVIIIFTAIAFLTFWGFKWMADLRAEKDEDWPDSAGYNHYFSLILTTIIFMVMYSGDRVGLPYLIAGSRMCCLIQFCIVAMCLIPLDAVCHLLTVWIPETFMKLAAVVIVSAIYVLTQLTGYFHGYLYLEYTRYNGAIMTTYWITETLPKQKYTIVSTVDELYQMIDYGFHEETVLFINDCVKSNYTLPSEYVFIYVEKHPFQYGQSHFFTGPKWLATPGKYTEINKRSSGYTSQAPDLIAAEITEELSRAPFYQFPISSSSYNSLSSRAIVESRIYRWCQEFMELYPGEMHTYYEDDDFVCYYFKQNPACLYQLGFDLQ